MRLSQQAARGFLTPRAKQVLRHLEVYRARQQRGMGDGFVSTRNIENDIDISQSSLTRRLTDLQEVGSKIEKRRRRNPATKVLFTEYRLAGWEEPEVDVAA